jgi:hypothetical protein
MVERMPEKFEGREPEYARPSRKADMRESKSRSRRVSCLLRQFTIPTRRIRDTWQMSRRSSSRSADSIQPKYGVKEWKVHHLEVWLVDGLRERGWQL